MDTLMERIRTANYADLRARRDAGTLRGLMFLHMKDGLSPPTIRRKASQASVVEARRPLSPCGVRQDLQQALSTLRTDLNLFSDNESNALMGCGYLMADHSMETTLSHLPGFMSADRDTRWPFIRILEDLTSLQEVSVFRNALLKEFEAGSKVRIRD